MSYNEKERQFTDKRNITARSRNQCSRGEAVNIKYSEWVVCSLSMRRMILSSVASSGSTIFFHTISLTARFSKKKGTEHKMRVLIFSTTFV